MRKWFSRRGKNKKGQRGQGMTEYVIIVALIAIASIAVVTVFGDNIRGLFGMSAEALAGEAEATDTRTKRVSDQYINKGLDDFGEKLHPDG